MKLSQPIYQLKRRAKRLAHDESIPLHQALDRVATQEGMQGWSLLAARHAARSPAAILYEGLVPGELVLVGARPGQGKTLMALELAVEGVRAGRQSAFFTLEYSRADVADRLRALGVDPDQLGDLFACDCSDAICADYIVDTLRDIGPGALVAIDYLQLLDQRRENPPLAQQVARLKGFAQSKGAVIVFVAQIDRAYDASAGDFPGLGDIRMPNPIDMASFTTACFLNQGSMQVQRLG